jgi:hypothetical protein
MSQYWGQGGKWIAIFALLGSTSADMRLGVQQPPPVTVSCICMCLYLCYLLSQGDGTQ